MAEILGRRTRSHSFARNAKVWGAFEVEKTVNQAFGT